jgi:hypothetical protein
MMHINNKKKFQLNLSPVKYTRVKWIIARTNICNLRSSHELHLKVQKPSNHVRFRTIVCNENRKMVIAKDINIEVKADIVMKL